MISGLIAGVFGIALLAALGDGELGAAGVAVVIIVLVLALGSAGRQGSRAVNNFVDYWADGGPDRNK